MLSNTPKYNVRQIENTNITWFGALWIFLFTRGCSLERNFSFNEEVVAELLTYFEANGKLYYKNSFEKLEDRHLFQIGASSSNFHSLCGMSIDILNNKMEFL